MTLISLPLWTQKTFFWWVYCLNQQFQVLWKSTQFSSFYLKKTTNGWTRMPSFIYTLYPRKFFWEVYLRPPLFFSVSVSGWVCICTKQRGALPLHLWDGFHLPGIVTGKSHTCVPVLSLLCQEKTLSISKLSPVLFDPLSLSLCLSIFISDCLLVFI